MSGLNITQFKTLVVKPTLEDVGLGGERAVNLVTGTALVESGLCYLTQNGGPALGLFQMEPVTLNDIMNRFIRTRPALKRYADWFIGNQPSTQALVTNLMFAAYMCRLRYLMDPTSIPCASSASLLAGYWKKVYNTPQGAGRVETATPLFQKAIDA